MTVFLNNSRRRDHVKIYNSVDAFFDLATEGMQATKAVGLEPGTECVVATPVGDYEIRFTWFAFSHEATMPDDLGEQCRVFFGKRLRSETMPKSKAVITEPYDVFFTGAGGFKRLSVIPAE